MTNQITAILILVLLVSGCGAVSAPPAQQSENEYEMLSGPAFACVKELYAAGQKAEAATLLRSLAADDNWEVRTRAVKAIGDANDRSLLPVVHAALTDKSLEVRESAGRVLTWLGDDTSIPPLMKALSDSEPVIRIRAVEALAHIGGESQIKTLTWVAEKDKDPSVRAAAAEALSELNAQRNEAE